MVPVVQTQTPPFSSRDVRFSCPFFWNLPFAVSSRFSLPKSILVAVLVSPDDSNPTADANTSKQSTRKRLNLKICKGKRNQHKFTTMTTTKATNCMNTQKDKTGRIRHYSSRTTSAIPFIIVLLLLICTFPSRTTRTTTTVASTRPSPIHTTTVIL